MHAIWIKHFQQRFNQGCGVGGKLRLLPSKIFRLRLLHKTCMKFGCQQFCSNWQSVDIVIRGTQQEFCFNKIPKETVPFEQARVRIPNLGMRCKK